MPPIILGNSDPNTANLNTISHSGLGDLTVDDHSQYHNNTRGDVRYYTKTALAASGGTAPVHFENITNFLTNTITEASAGSGVTADGVLLKDGYIRLTEQVDPATPATGYGYLFVDTDSKLKFKNDAGTVYVLSTTEV